MALTSQIQVAAPRILKGGVGIPGSPAQTWGDVDSSNIVVPRIDSYVQRVGGNIGDLAGKIFNSNGGAISLVTVEYSQIGFSGPWLPLTVLSGDPLYSFPAVGTPAGTAFNVPIEITDNYTGNVYFRIEISSPLPNTEDIAGPYAFTYIPPTPGLPISITVPEESDTGNYDILWGAADKADYYELEEDTDPAFSMPTLVYIGNFQELNVEDKALGTYYYRVRGVNAYGNGPWLEGSNGIDVLPLKPPGALGVPLQNFTGYYKLVWPAVDGATAYEVEEDVAAAFSNPKRVYDGPDTECFLKKKESGTFYYRVRARRGT